MICYGKNPDPTRNISAFSISFYGKYKFYVLFLLSMYIKENSDFF